MLLFWGRPRNADLFEKSRERTGFWFPLFVLAVVSLIGGSRVLEIKQFVAQAVVETENYCNAVAEPSAPPFGGFDNTWPITAERTSDAVQRFEDVGQKLFNQYAIWPFSVGIVLGFLFYCRRSSIKGH